MDIATASAEQSSGIEQINKALNQMDEVTQQNSALVEENAATARTLEQQAEATSSRVAFFKLETVDEVGQRQDVHEPRNASSLAPSRGPSVEECNPIAA